MLALAASSSDPVATATGIGVALIITCTSTIGLIATGSSYFGRSTSVGFATATAGIAPMSCRLVAPATSAGCLVAAAFVGYCCFVAVADRY